MIDDVLRFLTDEMNALMQVELGRDPEPYVVASTLTNPDGTVALGIDQRVVLTVVNVERETAAGTGAHRAMRPDADHLMLGAAPLALNLLLLVSSHHPRYAEALRRLSLALAYVQSHPLLDRRSRPGFPLGADRLTLELVNLDFSQLNNLWSVCGIKHLPSVVVKVRMVSVDLERAERRVARVEGITRGVVPDSGREGG